MVKKSNEEVVINKPLRDDSHTHVQEFSHIHAHLVVFSKEPEYLVATFRLSKLLDTNSWTIVPTCVRKPKNASHDHRKTELHVLDQLCHLSYSTVLHSCLVVLNCYITHVTLYMYVAYTPNLNSSTPPGHALTNLGSA